MVDFRIVVARTAVVAYRGSLIAADRALHYHQRRRAENLFALLSIDFAAAVEKRMAFAVVVEMVELGNSATGKS